MSPIEKHRVSQLTQRLAEHGALGATVSVISAAADNWCFRVVVGDREFVIEFNHRDLLRVHETTPGREQQFAVAECGRVCTTTDAEAEAARWVSVALVYPDHLPRIPPIL